MTQLCEFEYVPLTEPLTRHLYVSALAGAASVGAEHERAEQWGAGCYGDSPHVLKLRLSAARVH